MMHPFIHFSCIVFSVVQTNCSKLELTMLHQPVILPKCMNMSRDYSHMDLGKSKYNMETVCLLGMDDLSCKE